MSNLDNLNPLYFYKDETGAIKKYVYCRLCHAGPYKQNEENTKFIFFGMGNKEPFCKSCAIIHNYFKPTSSKKDSVARLDAFDKIKADVSVKKDPQEKEDIVIPEIEAELPPEKNEEINFEKNMIGEQLSLDLDFDDLPKG